MPNMVIHLDCILLNLPNHICDLISPTRLYQVLSVIKYLNCFPIISVVVSCKRVTELEVYAFTSNLTSLDSNGPNSHVWVNQRPSVVVASFQTWFVRQRSKFRTRMDGTASR